MAKIQWVETELTNYARYCNRKADGVGWPSHNTLYAIYKYALRIPLHKKSPNQIKTPAEKRTYREPDLPDQPEFAALEWVLGQLRKDDYEIIFVVYFSYTKNNKKYKFKDKAIDLFPYLSPRQSKDKLNYMIDKIHREIECLYDVYDQDTILIS